MVCAWSFHNADRFIRVKVGGSPNDMDLVFGSEFSHEVGGLVSYAKLFKVPDSESLYRVLFRVQYGTGSRSDYAWSSCSFFIDARSKSVVWTGPERVLVSATNGRVPYLSTCPDSEDESIIRFALGYHPSTPGTQAPIRYGTYDVVNNSVSNAAGQLLWSLDSPIDNGRIDRDLEYVIGPTETDGVRRRFLGVAAGPSLPAVLFADWEEEQEDEGTYYVGSMETDALAWKVEALGPAGTRFGHSETANYLAGATFMPFPRRSEDVYTLANLGAETIVNHCSRASLGWIRNEVGRLPYTAVRPTCLMLLGERTLLASRIESYGSEAGGFTSFDGRAVFLNV